MVSKEDIQQQVMGMGGNGNSPHGNPMGMGISQKMGMGMGGNGNWIDGKWTTNFICRGPSVRTDGSAFRESNKTLFFCQRLETLKRHLIWKNYWFRLPRPQAAGSELHQRYIPLPRLTTVGPHPMNSHIQYAICIFPAPGWQETALLPILFRLLKPGPQWSPKTEPKILQSGCPFSRATDGVEALEEWVPALTDSNLKFWGWRHSAT